MAKLKKTFVCQQCGAQSSQWSGQCNDCHAWNSIIEEVIEIQTNAKQKGYAAEQNKTVTLLSNVKCEQQHRLTSGSQEFDRVLGGGLIPGSVILLGGNPGIGKSTLLLQTACQLSKQYRALYITGEESLEQVALRAKRLELPDQKLELLAETNVDRILALAQKQNPQILVIDSIQTMYVDAVTSAPGSVSQVREATAELVRFAKQTGTVLLIVGHVTKEGSLAGPRVLEHMVDTVLYFEDAADSRFRVIRAVKNRFGAVNEIGIFAMTEKGVKAVSNPSAIFLSRDQQTISGSVTMVTWEGTRPLLIEIQALVDDCYGGNPRRLAVGVEQNRLAMLLAVLHRHGSIAMYQNDVFVNAVGGVRILETASDLAMLLAVTSSLKNKSIPHDWVVFGEVGLAGEIRPVPYGQERLREAAKHGFKRAIVPKSNTSKQTIDGLDVIGVNHLSQALQQV